MENFIANQEPEAMRVEQVALLLKSTVIIIVNCIVEKEISLRLIWIKLKSGREMWVFFSAYGAGTQKEEEEEEVRNRFEEELTDFMEGFNQLKV